MSIPNGTYTFESVQFPGVYLRMDGRGVEQGGHGVVNCQYTASSWETFQLVSDGDCYYTIKSTSAAFPEVFLSMDGTGVVDCHFGAGQSEKFKLIYNGSDYSFSVQSVSFRVYLSMDAREVQHQFPSQNAGTVKSEIAVGPSERFKLKSVEN